LIPILHDEFDAVVAAKELEEIGIAEISLNIDTRKIWIKERQRYVQQHYRKEKAYKRISDQVTLSIRMWDTPKDEKGNEWEIVLLEVEKVWSEEYEAFIIDEKLIKSFLFKDYEEALNEYNKKKYRAI
jgi:hypothetical protein